MKPIRPAPLVTLTTDFGLADHYVGTMKGVLLSRCPGVRIIDISHDLPPFSIHSGAYTIDQAARYYPAATIHVIVIDPGVGTARKPILLEALNQFFIAPDNGVLSMIIARDPKAKARELANRDLWLSSPSSTFHGRDVFAPVAAALASGAANAQKVGPILTKLELLPDLDARQVKAGRWEGKLLSIDRFGNAITNFNAAAFPRLAASRFSMRIGRHRITTFASTFGDAADGVCFAYVGSSGFIELAVKQQSAAALLNAAAGDRVTLQL
jgi:S-adenosyl-L-methionine hydrolase (adenosine-forming)